jgi:hypothetical protein
MRQRGTWADRARDRTALLTREQHHIVFRMLHLGKDEFRPSANGLAVVRELRAACHERHAQFLFELADRLGQRGLGQTHRLGRGADAAVLGNGHYSAQLVVFTGVSGSPLNTEGL